MTITNLQTATSITDGGDNLLATKTTLQTGTSAVELHVSLTPGEGTAQNSGRSKVRGHLVVSPFDIEADEAAKAFQNQYEEVEIMLNQETGVPIIKKTDLVPALGLYAYVWFTLPVLSPAAFLDVKLVELN